MKSYFSREELLPERLFKADKKYLLVTLHNNDNGKAAQKKFSIIPTIHPQKTSIKSTSARNGARNTKYVKPKRESSSKHKKHPKNDCLW